MFITYNLPGVDPERKFTTVRNAVAFTAEGTNLLTPETLLTDSRDEVDDMTVAEYLQAFAGEEDRGTFSEILGVGITGTEGTVVSSISFDGNTYYFGTGDCLREVPVDPEAPVVTEDPAPAVDPVAVPKKPVSVETGR